MDIRKGDIVHNFSNNKKASNLLGWQVGYSLVEGFEKW